MKQSRYDSSIHKGTQPIRVLNGNILNWFENADVSKNYQSQIRYHGSFLTTSILDETTITIETTESLPLGQSVVIYKDNRVIGGGIIDKVVSSS